MHIDSYDFGRIVINGTTYTKDVIIISGDPENPGRVISPWWRKEGHSLAPEDLADCLNNRDDGAPPELLIIGTGNMGAMTVPAPTLAFLHKMGIKTSIIRTGLAIDEFNRTPDSRSTVAALHLTC